MSSTLYKILKNCGLLLSENKVKLRKFWLLNSSNAYATVAKSSEGVIDVKFTVAKLNKPVQDLVQFQFFQIGKDISIVELGTKLCLDIWDEESPSLKLYKRKSNPKQFWNLDNEQCSIRSAANPNVSFKIVFVPYTILSMNVGYYIVQNQLGGSESWFVNLCRKTYPNNNGMSSVAQLSQCTKNAMDMILSCITEPFDLIGFQEMSSEVPIRYLIEQFSLQKGEEWEFHFASIDGFLLSNIKTMGRGRKFTKEGQQSLDTKDQRAFCGVWFPSVATIAISMHVGHGYEKKLIAELETFLEKRITAQFLKNSGEISIDVIKHVVIMGDFNYKVIDREIHAFGKSLQVYGGAKNNVETCCQEGHTSDHIFTSDLITGPPTPLYFGLPLCDSAKKVNGQNFVMQSDHLAVVSGVENVFKQSQK